MRRFLPVLLLAASGPAQAATLLAGTGTAFPQPSAAIAAAAPGDTVSIAPDTYYDCAAWRTDGLTIEGRGAVFSDLACQGKASFVIGGNGTVLRGLEFTHLRVADGNGAGVRLEGGGLLVEDCAFDDDQAAVMASPGPDEWLVLRRVSVRSVGVAGGSLAAVTLSGMGGVRIEDSVFVGGRGEGGALRSGVPTVVSRSTFAYGTGGTPVIEVSGPVAIEGASFTLSGQRPAAIRAVGPGAVVRDTRFDDGNAGGVLLQDWTGSTTELSGNLVGPEDVEVSRFGRVVYRAKNAVREAVGTLRHLAGWVRRRLP